MAHPSRSLPLLALAALPLLAACAARPAAADPGRYDVVWTTPSADASGTMPLGNGEVALNAWVEPDGALRFYLARTDAWSENGRLLKVGRLRFTADPPLDPAGGFVQRLDLADGAMVVRVGAGAAAAELRLWVDAHHPVVHVELDSARPRRLTATIEPWRTERERYPLAETSDLREDRSQPDKLRDEVWVEPDELIEDLPGRVGWYHFNRRAHGTAELARIQGLSEVLDAQPDPLLHRVFGAVVEAADGERLDRARLSAPPRARQAFRVHVRTEHPSDPQRWLAATLEQAERLAAVPTARLRAAHEAWWEEFWGRSWIHLEQTAPSAGAIPANPHPVRVGVDQHGGNRFVGEIDSLRLRLGDGPEAVFESPDSGPLADSAAWRFDQGFEIRARLRPGALPAGGGRILDDVTPGVSDGVLLDTYPGNSLRLIAGPLTLTAPGALPAGAWAEVVARWDAATQAAELLVDGVSVARSAAQLDDAATVARGYALQRWIDACAGRGRYPIKFNGSLFTVPHTGSFGDADYRRWGPGYWWQNTRLPYLSMCASGDFEMLAPLFRMYAEEQLAVHLHRTRQYTGHGGLFVPECLYFWGPAFAATYGWTPFAERGADKLQESGWHKWEWVSGLELVWMMLDAYEHTGDAGFARATVLPFAREVLTFFREHYPLGEDGRLRMTPSQALETWWDCTDPMPEVAGLRAVTARLLALPPALGSAEERALWREVAAVTPELPTWEKDGQRLLAPAARFADKRNVENPELYAVFPFRLVSFEKDDAALGVRALENRWDRGAAGWRQDDLFMTHLGLAEEARANLVARARNSHAGSRFPAFWGPNYDWVPDQDHGGVLMRALQTMLLQTEGRAIHLLPAWPSGWDASFRLHAPLRTTLEGRVVDGELVELRVDPPSRRADLVVHAPAPAG